MRVLRNVLRVYSYIFEAALCLIAIAVSGVTLLSGNEELKLGWLPWTGAKLPVWLLLLGIIGLLTLLLAVFKKRRTLFFLFSIFVLVLLARGFVFSPYTFSAGGEVRQAMLSIAGALLAMVGAWTTPARTQRRKR